MGPPDGRQVDTRKRPRSYAGRTKRRLDDARPSGAGPGEPGDEERTTMARATTAPVPVMTKNDMGSAGKGSGARATAGAAAAKGAGKGAGGKYTAKASATKTSGKSAKVTKRQLGGPWGASFEGVNPDGSKVKGLTWDRRFTRQGVHPYDEIEWELRTAAIA